MHIRDRKTHNAERTKSQNRSHNDRLGERLKSERRLMQSWGQGKRVTGLILISLAVSATIYAFQ